MTRNTNSSLIIFHFLTKVVHILYNDCLWGVVGNKCFEAQDQIYIKSGCMDCNANSSYIFDGGYSDLFKCLDDKKSMTFESKSRSKYVNSGYMALLYFCYFPMWYLGQV